MMAGNPPIHIPIFHFLFIYSLSLSLLPSLHVYIRYTVLLEKQQKMVANKSWDFRGFQEKSKNA
jgi:hypothetical protein